MKFGKSIGCQQEENSDLYYVEYKNLKKKIKDIVVHLQAHELCQALDTNTAFEEALSNEIRQVNACFSRRQKELLGRTTALSEEINASEVGGSSSSAAPAAEEGAESCTAIVPAEEKVAKNPDALQRLVGLLLDVYQLRKYAVWNAVAVVKILKKRRKQTSFGIEDVAAERGGWLSRQTFFSGSDFAELHAAVESLGHALVLSELGPFGGSSKSLLEKQEETQQCPICLDTISDMVELECSHRFCWKCFVLGPIAALPQEYRMTQCPICRQDTAISSSGPLALADSKVSMALHVCRESAQFEGSHSGAGFPGDVAMSRGDWQNSEGILSRFLHTYFPHGGGLKGEEQDSDGEDDASEVKRESSEPEHRDVVGELVKAVFDGAAGGLLNCNGVKDETQGQSSSSAAAAGDFFNTLPPARSPQDKLQLSQAQKLQWLQLASTNDPLALDSTTYCSLCSEPLLMEAVVTTPCKHHFHRVCVTRLDMPNCPLCKESLPFSWFLPHDHPLAETGFRVIPVRNYRPYFPGGPSRGSCGYPLHQPPPARLFGADGMEMHSYLHRMAPTGDDEDEPGAAEGDSDCGKTPGVTPASGAGREEEEEGSSMSDSSSDESNSEDGGQRSRRAEKRWAYSALGRIRLVDAFDPPDGASIAATADGTASAGVAAGTGAGGSSCAAEKGGSDSEPEQRNPTVLLIGDHL